MVTEVSIRELYELNREGTDLEKDQYEVVQLQGWIRTNRAGKNVGEIVPLWDADLARFKEARQNYLIYR